MNCLFTCDYALSVFTCDFCFDESVLWLATESGDILTAEDGTPLQVE